MPTYEEEPGFADDYDRLSKQQQELFLVAVAKLVADLKQGQLRAGLRIKPVHSQPGVYEMTWAPDGRATFSFGRAVRAGETHVVWRRVGTHDIFARP